MGIADEKVPAAGAWASCPKCRERFYIRPAGRPSPLELDGGAPLRPGTAPPGRDAESQRLLDRLKVKSGARGDDDFTEFDPAAITLYPEPLGWPRARMAATWVLLAMPILGIVVFFLYLGRREPSPPPELKAIARMNDEERAEMIINDLLSLKRKLQHRRRVNRFEVDYRGPESRLFNHFRKVLVPGLCREGVSQISLSSPYPNNGFTATGLCLGEGLRELTMDVRWPENSAVVSFPAYPAQGQAELEIFPAAGPEQ